MSEATAIVLRARRLGLCLQVEGDRLAIAPAKLCPPELLTALREQKPAIVALLESQAAGLSPDEGPWLHVAKQVLKGEFDGCDRSTNESLAIGLRSIVHPVCRRAIERLQKRTPKR